MKYPKNIVLLSSSPRRKEILKKAGFKFSIFHPKVKETKFSKGFSKTELMRNALRKLNAFPKKLKEDQILIAADTVVVLGKQVLGKPRSIHEAGRFLGMLSGKKHQVYTAVVLGDLSSEKIRSLIIKTDVIFRHLSQPEIQRYIKTSEPYDKAGAYAIQGRARSFVKSIRGSRSNVVGLPIEKMKIVLKRFMG